MTEIKKIPAEYLYHFVSIKTWEVQTKAYYVES